MSEANSVERPVRPVAWLRQQRGAFEGRQTLDPLFVLGDYMPRNFLNGATYEALYDQAAVDAARMAGVRSVQEQTSVIVRAALELLESIEGETPFTAEAVRAFKRVFGA